MTIHTIPSQANDTDLQPFIAALNIQAGDTVNLPPGRYQYRTTIKPAVPFKLVGAGMGYSGTILYRPADVTEAQLEDGNHSRQFFQFDIYGDASQLDISHIWFRGSPAQVSLNGPGDHSHDRCLRIMGGYGWRVHHCRFDWFGQVSIEAVQYASGGNWRGLVDNCYFWECAKVGDLSRPDKTTLGYGVQCEGDANIDWATLGAPAYDDNYLFIEGNIFVRCRHGVASTYNGKYWARFNTFIDCRAQSVDAHGPGFGSTQGTLASVVHDNLILSNTWINDLVYNLAFTNRYDNPPGDTVANDLVYIGIYIRGGQSAVWNNKIRGIRNGLALRMDDTSGSYPHPGQIGYWSGLQGSNNGTGWPDRGGDLFYWSNDYAEPDPQAFGAEFQNAYGAWLLAGRDYHNVDLSTIITLNPPAWPHPLRTETIPDPDIYSDDPNLTALYLFNNDLTDTTEIQPDLYLPNPPVPPTLIAMEFDSPAELDFLNANATVSGGNLNIEFLGTTTAVHGRKSIPNLDYGVFDILFYPGNSLSMADGSEHTIILVRNAAQFVGWVSLGYETANGFYLSITCKDDQGTETTSNRFYLGGWDQKWLAFEYQKSSGANDGYINLFVETVLELSLTDLDNDLYAIDNLFLGAPVGKDATTTGHSEFSFANVYESRPPWLLNSVAVYSNDAHEGSQSIDMQGNQSLYLDTFNQSSISIAAWVKLDSAAVNQTIVSKYDFGNNRRTFRLGTNVNGNIIWAVSGDGTAFTQLVYMPPPQGAWLHLCGVFDADSGLAYLYVAGEVVQIIHTGYEAGLHNNTAPLVVGSLLDSDSPVHFAQCLIDELVILDRPISAAEVASLYQNGVLEPDTDPDPPPPPPPPIDPPDPIPTRLQVSGNLPYPIKGVISISTFPPRVEIVDTSQE